MDDPRHDYDAFSKALVNWLTLLAVGLLALVSSFLLSGCKSTSFEITRGGETIRANDVRFFLQTKASIRLDWVKIGTNLYPSVSVLANSVVDSEALKSLAEGAVKGAVEGAK